MSLAGGVHGVMLSIIIPNEMEAINVAGFINLVFCLSAGCFVNVGADSSWFVRALARISPLRYGNELLFRQLTDEDTI